MATTQDDSLIIETVMLAGKIMVENGADMARVDSTLKRIACNAGIDEPKIFETTTGITMSIPRRYQAQVEPITKRTIDLEKVSRVNEASRAFQAHKMTLQEFYNKLVEIDTAAPFFAFYWQLIAAALMGALLVIMYGSSWEDFLPTVIVSALGFSCFYFFNTRFKIRFVSEFIAALVIGFFAVIFVRMHFGTTVNQITIGALMPLVPGVPLTNAVRDLLAGHILSGIARGAEAALSACALGLGIAFILRFM
ncbi:threonine/serine exporter family protein [Ligilactobacillus sp. WILCCON 0076]|uniref:Threonine/serine exporter family protein n=1 Tax=Ligilactobacillus ubinensis TaxID=2876789 RepID=A0A9X2FMU4_9LACO|nr:threonine/serine exporter family protein [Ligilactobacillus ubinensis]MCP0887213.1 threonine/serine exporter family protein [Ligilactobacillus ubinensis]